MTINPKQLRILRYPAPELRVQAAPIEHIDDLVRAVAARMIDLMHEAERVGLAAPQFGLPWRMFVTLAQGEAKPQVFINPHLQHVSVSPRGQH